MGVNYSAASKSGMCFFAQALMRRNCTKSCDHQRHGPDPHQAVSFVGEFPAQTDGDFIQGESGDLRAQPATSPPNWASSFNRRFSQVICPGPTGARIGLWIPAANVVRVSCGWSVSHETLPRRIRSTTFTQRQLCHRSRETATATTICGELKDHPAIWAWSLGNERPVLPAARCNNGQAMGGRHGADHRVSIRIIRC